MYNTMGEINTFSEGRATITKIRSEFNGRSSGS